MEEKGKLLTQLFTETESDGMHYLECEKTEYQVLERMEHLSNVVETVRKTILREGRHRYILEAGTRELALQAASATASLLAADWPVKEAPEDEEEDEFWDLDVEEEGQDHFLLLEETHFTKEMEEQEIMLQLWKQSMDIDQGEDALADADYVFIQCGNPMNRILPEKIQNLDKKIVILWAEESAGNERLLERFVFEQGFQIMRVKTPDKPYYYKLFGDYLKLCGKPCEDTERIRTLTERLIHYRNQYFQKKDIFRYIDAAVDNMRGRGGTNFTEEDFELPCIRNGYTAKQRLENMIGLESVKEQIEKICAFQILCAWRSTEGHKLRRMHCNLIFAGEPGTGKSEAALACSEILSEERVTNGNFVKADKSDVIGKYVGHTAPKVKKLFDDADGGILFIDEAGSLTSNDEFTKEAVTELVRYMEERPQTIVIFASYPDKIEEFLSLDAGLRSRISRVIHFPSYSCDELIQILHRMETEYGCKVEKACEPLIRNYLERLRTSRKSAFGNAREVRKLLESAYRNYSVRALKRKQKTGKEPDYILRKRDFEEAVQELMPEKPVRQKIGFAIPEVSGKGVGR